MHNGGFKRWVVLGALVSVSWLASACGALPQQPGNESFSPGFVRNPAQAGYNGTIKDIPTSIDPRTRETEGTPGRSLLFDAGQRARLEQQGMGGSGYVPTNSPGSGLDPARQQPASLSIPGQDFETSGGASSPEQR